MSAVRILNPTVRRCKICDTLIQTGQVDLLARNAVQTARFCFLFRQSILQHHCNLDVKHFCNRRKSKDRVCSPKPIMIIRLQAEKTIQNSDFVVTVSTNLRFWRKQSWSIIKLNTSLRPDRALGIQAFPHHGILVTITSTVLIQKIHGLASRQQSCA
jgi:hypothetical protein